MCTRALAAADADYRELAARRRALLAALSRRPAVHETLLRLDEGADHDEAWVTLRRAGGAGWTSAAYAEVPGWHQGTMKDWRNYFHCNCTYGCWRPNLRFPADAARLALDRERLAGDLEVAFGLDRPMLERQPPGGHVQWWDRFIMGGHAAPRRVRYAVDAEVHPDRRLLELVLEGGVYWDDAFAPNPKGPAPSRVTRRPIFVRLQVPCTRFTGATVRTPSWVGGFHEAEPAGLAFAGGRLSGTLVVYLHQDGWAPWGRGKHTQHEPITVSFEVDARLAQGQLSGRYSASFGGKIKGRHYNPRGDDSEVVTLPETRYEGAISGRGGRLVAGRYSAEGDFGACAGALDGMLLDEPRAPSEEAGPPDGPPSVAGVNAILHQIRALHLALGHEALPYSEAWRQCAFAAPADCDLAEYLRLAARQVAALPSPGRADALRPKAETVGDSPSFGVAPAPVEGEDANVLEGPAEGWLFLPRWSVLGPFEQRPGLEHDSAPAPDLVVVPGARYAQPVDRFGREAGHGQTQSWTPVACADARLGAPWERSGPFPRYGGRVWYGTAVLRTGRARTVWLSVEANDFAKLWVNDRLAWADAERTWRYRSYGRRFVPVALAAGDNRLLVRVHGDYQLSWLRLALTAKEPATPPAEGRRGAREADPHVFPDARPPLAWDIGGGVNVAWRNEPLSGRTRPLVVGDAVFVTSGAGTLTCVEAASGAPRWSREVAETDVPAVGKGFRAEAGDVVSVGGADGPVVALASGFGTVAACDAGGALLWSRPTGMPSCRLWTCGRRFVVEGQVPVQGRGAAPTVRVLALDPAAGGELWRRELPGRLTGDGRDLTTGSASALLTSTGSLLDAATGDPLPAPDWEMQMTDRDGAAVRNVTAGPYRLHAGGGMFYLTSQARHLAVRLWDRGGRLGSAHAWESNYGSSGFGNVPAPGLGWDAYLFTWHSVLAHTPHNPDPRAEVDVQDARDGRWLARRKPVMDDLYSYGALNLSTPVVAGDRLYLLGGRSNNSRNQIAVVTADERLQVLARQDVEPGTTQPPVFAGDAMILRSPQSLLCVAVRTPEGEKYQRLELARMLFVTIGREPRTAEPRDVPGLDRVGTGGAVPVGKLMNERPTQFWLGAGPFPPADLEDEAALAGLRPETGSEFRGRTFAPLSREFAYDEPPAYVRTAELQGTGDITPRFSTRVDPRCVAGPAGAGLLYAVLDNTRDRIVAPALGGTGIAQWLGGRKLAPDERLRLAPGLYPYLVRVGPEFYRVEELEILPPVKVTEALAGGALSDVGWPTRWQVLGPLSGHATPLTSAQMREVPESLTVDRESLRLFPFEAPLGALDLGCLVHTLAGEPPAHGAAYVRAAEPVTAYAFAAVGCPADGYLYVNATCEYYMRWHLDGEIVYDRMKEGNRAPHTDLNAHPFAVRVTRGRHVLAVQLAPGGGSWTMRSAGGFSERRGDEMPQFRAESKIERRPPDFRLQPCFREIPHSGVLRRTWLDRIRASEARLRAVADGLPGTEEAARARALLAGIEGAR